MADAYTYALTLLARRELCEVQIRIRLKRRGHLAPEIDEAVTRLHAERALDDRRTARAFARTETRLNNRSRRWVLRRLHGLGIASDIAENAVQEVFENLDERALLEATLDRRLRGGASPTDTAVQWRLHRYLINQGFETAEVVAALQARARSID
jgi:regulatory protein